jgi:hypothetical protein
VSLLTSARGPFNSLAFYCAPQAAGRDDRMAGVWCVALSLVVASGTAQTTEPSQTWDATLHLHHPETAAKFDAKCLDGKHCATSQSRLFDMAVADADASP